MFVVSSTFEPLGRWSSLSSSRIPALRFFFFPHVAVSLLFLSSAFGSAVHFSQIFHVVFFNGNHPHMLCCRHCVVYSRFLALFSHQPF